MDILAHGVYNIALQKTIKNRKQRRGKIIEAFWWGIMPDLLAFGIPLIASIFIRGSFNHHAIFYGINIAKSIYPFTHSLVIFAAFFVFVSLIRKKWYLPMLGWGFHVLLDIPLHTPSFFPTPFLFPISPFTLPFGISWSTPIIWVSTWIIGISWLIIVYRKSND